MSHPIAVPVKVNAPVNANWSGSRSYRDLPEIDPCPDCGGNCHPGVCEEGYWLDREYEEWCNQQAAK